MKKLKVRGVVNDENEAEARKLVEEMLRSNIPEGAKPYTTISKFIDLNFIQDSLTDSGPGKFELLLGDIPGAIDLPEKVYMTPDSYTHSLEHVSGKNLINSRNDGEFGGGQYLINILGPKYQTGDHNLAWSGPEMVRYFSMLDFRNVRNIEMIGEMIANKSYTEEERVAIIAFFKDMRTVARKGKGTTIWNQSIFDNLDVYLKFHTYDKEFLGVNEFGHADIKLKTFDISDGEPLEFRLKICVKDECTTNSDIVYEKGDLISAFPLCGKGVIRLPSLEQLLALETAFNRDGAFNSKLRKTFPKENRCTDFDVKWQKRIQTFNRIMGPIQRWYQRKLGFGPR